MASTKGLNLTRHTVGSPDKMNLMKITFKDMVDAEFEEVKSDKSDKK